VSISSLSRRKAKETCASLQHMYSFWRNRSTQLI